MSRTFKALKLAAKAAN